MGAEPNSPVTQKYAGCIRARARACVSSDNMETILLNGLNGSAVQLAMPDVTCGPGSFA